MIRDTFQPELDEFAGDLESYATGSYLSEEDRVLFQSVARIVLTDTAETLREQASGRRLTHA